MISRQYSFQIGQMTMRNLHSTQTAPARPGSVIVRSTGCNQPVLVRQLPVIATGRFRVVRMNGLQTVQALI